MKDKKTILIVEDKLISAEYLSSILKDNGYMVLDIADTGYKAIEIAKREKPDVVLMDIMLKEKMSGIEAAMEISHHTPNCKIIYLTSYSNKEIINYVYESRAYGYLLKPYREQEILVTLQLALLQDEKKRPSPKIKLLNGYFFNTKLHRLYQKDREVPLSKNAHKLLEILAKNRDQSVSNEQICYHVWYKNRSDNVLRALVHRVREKTDTHLIENVKGVGYITYS